MKELIKMLGIMALVALITFGFTSYLNKQDRKYEAENITSGDLVENKLNGGRCVVKDDWRMDGYMQCKGQDGLVIYGDKNEYKLVN